MLPQQLITAPGSQMKLARQVERYFPDKESLLSGVWR